MTPSPTLLYLGSRGDGLFIRASGHPHLLNVASHRAEKAERGLHIAFDAG
jgi:hypothetical protein